uniref:Uncharacterized protein n=1 Tax=Anguilla anguilla TaxID=7936 RepID=A0A0E9QYH0_ANGAN
MYSGASAIYDSNLCNQVLIFSLFSKFLKLYFLFLEILVRGMSHIRRLFSCVF